MAETKYGKYIVTQARPDRRASGGPEKNNLPDNRTYMAYLDNKIIPGGIYVECVWLWKAFEYPVEPHSHDFDEVLAFFGTDPENPEDLCGEVELCLGDEQHLLTKSCLVYVPKGLKHCPMIIRRADRPIFHFSTGNATEYIRNQATGA